MKAITPEEYIYSFALFGRKGGYKPGLARMKYLFEQVGNPHHKFPIIHIGGTNGKGSTATYVDYVLQEKNMKTGRFTSPHLSHYGERMLVNNRPISEDELNTLIKELAPIIDNVEKKTNFGRPSFFEVTTFLALYYFAQNNIDMGVIEVGLGGLKDATNIVEPLVTGITNISLEHTKQLGSTIEEISLQKAGIIKKGIPIITGASGAALEVIQKKAKQKEAPFIDLESSYKWNRLSHDFFGQTFNLITPRDSYEAITIKMVGRHQIVNAVCALALLENLPKEYNISKKDIINGLAKAFWPGRLEVWSGDPLIILDGAHNPGGFVTLIDYLKEEYPDKKVVFILSFLEDKDTAPFQKMIEDVGAAVIFAQIDNFRAASPKTLMQRFSPLQIPMEEASSIKGALNRSKELAGLGGVICLAGSLYAVGEGREVLNSLEISDKF